VSRAIPRRLLICALAGLTAAACTTTSTPPATPAPAPGPEDSAAARTVSPHAARWTPRRAAGSWRYEFQSTGSVSLTGDTTANSLPLGRTVIYTLAIEPATALDASTLAFQLSGSVDSVAVTIPERIPTPTAGTNSNPRFQGTMTASGHLASLTSNATTPCTDATDPLSAAVTGLLVAFPDGISPTQSWTDTVVTVTCRGRLPLVTTVTRHYTAITDTVWRGEAAVLLTRHDSSTIQSRPDSAAQTAMIAGVSSPTQARDSAEAMTASGTGYGDFEILVDPHSGVLLEARGTSHTNILVTTANSRFPFQESASQTITLLR